MPVTPTFPGVYIEEIPSGLHTITGVATSIGAFIDTFARGPLNWPVHLLSMSDFERELGGLEATSDASYAIQQFFLNGGSEAFAIRVAGGAAKAASLAVKDGTGGGAGTVFTATAGRKIGDVNIDNPGAWGNLLRIEVDYNASDPTKQFNLTITEVDMAGNTVRSEVFRNLSTTSTDANFVVDVVNAASRIVYLTAGASANRPVATGTVGAVLPDPPPTPIAAANATCTVKINGAALPNKVTLKLPATNPPKDFPGVRSFLEAAIRASNPELGAATVDLWGTPGKFFFRVLTGRGRTKPTEVLEFDDTNAAPDVLATDFGLKAATADVQMSPFLNGTDDTMITDASIRGLPANKTGLYALENVDLFNILCLPAATTGTRLTLTATQVGLILAEATAYCSKRRAMLIVDVPPSVADVDGMLTWATQNANLRDRNSAVYFPRIRIPDALAGGRLRDVGPSGTLAGIWAATDVARGVWKAPAGVDAQLRNVPQLVTSLTDGENGTLNPLGLNCLRNFPIYGNVSWGARTLVGSDVQASDWKYIPIRRLALFLEESLFRGTKWVVFEPNDEPLWAQIRMNVGSFMQDLFRQGAFQGQTPQQAYLVKCDAEINTPYEVDRGIVNILVGFAPLKPAEFVIIQIQQLVNQTPA